MPPSIKNSLGLAFLTFGLSGCVTAAELDARNYVAIETFPSGAGPAELRMDKRSGAYSVMLLSPAYSDTQDLPIPLTGNVKIVTQSKVGLDPVTVIRGENQTCRSQYVILQIHLKSFSTKSLGNCRSDFDFTAAADGQSLTAKEVAAADPLVYLYQNERVYGPKRLSQTVVPSSVANTRSGKNKKVVQQPPAEYVDTSEPTGPRPPTRGQMLHVGTEAIPEAASARTGGNGNVPTLNLDDAPLPVN